MSNRVVTPAKSENVSLEPLGEFTPQLWSALRKNYGLNELKSDVIAGLTVAIVALPLAMAIGIASGTTPDRALVTAVIAGGLISALGGSHVQIGGPTAAFIVVVFNVIEHHGIDGLILATFLAGLILIVVGLLRLAVWIKYLPYPVIIGVSSGIAVSIFVSQIKELLGVNARLPGELLGKMHALWQALPTARSETIALAGLSIVLVLGVKRFEPRIPNMLATVVICSLVALLFHLNVDTIGSRFGGIPSSFPVPTVPTFDLAKLIAIVPSAITIALLAGIESLLSAIIADGLTGRRHRSNCELMAQGIANCASALFGGLCATGALARTATNIRAGGRTPVAGVLHAVFLLIFMLVAAPLLSYVPLATLAAILTVVAWNISEVEAIGDILGHAPVGDKLALSATFLLTVFTDITLAIEVGVVLSALIFMHRMAESIDIKTYQANAGEDGQAPYKETVSNGNYLILQLQGPFFFGTATKVVTTLENASQQPRAYILDFTAVPFVDITAISELANFVAKAKQMQAPILVVGANAQCQSTFKNSELAHEIGYATSVDAAIIGLTQNEPAKKQRS